MLSKIPRNILLKILETLDDTTLTRLAIDDKLIFFRDFILQNVISKERVLLYLEKNHNNLERKTNLWSEGPFSDYHYKLEYITIPEGVKHLGSDIFYKCILLKEVKLPNSIISIGHLAFSYCTMLKYIELPENLLWLGCNCFQNCSNLKSITIPKDL